MNEHDETEASASKIARYLLERGLEGAGPLSGSRILPTST